MKRKIFSTLLFGALAFVSLSTVTSCKDYDDDINDLSAKQASMLAQIESLQSSVSSNATAINEVKGTANDALNKAIAASTNADEAKTKAQNAIDAAKEAATAAATAQAGADAAAQKAQAALDAIGDETKGLVKRVADLEGKVAGLEAMKSELDTLKQDVAKCASKEDLAKLQAKFDSLNGWFNKVFAMVTNVELYGTFTGNDVQTPNTKNLTMMWGAVKYTSDFGDNEALANDLKTVFATATPVQNFVKGTDIKAPAGLVLNVQPANADLTTSKLLIVNSKGEALDDYVEVLTSEATRYDKVISTRGSSINTGLWNVPVQFKDGVDMKKFEEAIKVKVDGTDKDVLFAVAVNNTDTVKTYGGENRYVLSTFDLTVAKDDYTPATGLNFNVDGNAIANIHNRWDGAQATTGTTEPQQNVTSATPKEYKWNVSTEKDFEAPNAAMKQNNDKTKRNFEVNTGDNRSTKKLLNAKVGVPMVVEMPEAISGKVAYYYVTLDENFAIESAPSELNAWHTYSISGLNTVVKGTDKLQITVSDLKNVKNDVIGFRLYAIDNDGTLIDPDGLAFYALVGEPEAEATVDVTVHAENIVSGAAQSEPVALNKQFVASTTGLHNTIYAANGGLGKDWANGTIDKNATNPRIYYMLGKLNDDGDFETVTDWKDATHVVVRMAPVNAFQDGKSWTITAKGTAGNTLNNVVNVLNINVTKVMPTTYPESIGKVTWKTNQLTNGVYVCYMDPANNKWEANSAQGSKDLVQAINNLEKSENFIVKAANSEEKDHKYTEPKSAVQSSKTEADVVINAYTLSVDQQLIDQTTEHDLTITYNYKDISYRPNSDGDLKAQNLEVPVLSGKMVYACALDPSVQTYDWITKEIKKDGEVVDSWTNNFINYQTNAVGKKDDGTPGELNQLTLDKNVMGKNTYMPGSFPGALDITKWYVPGYTATLTTNEGENAGQAEYYNVTFEGNKLKFTKKSTSTNPTAVVKSTLTIKAKDAFGHEKEIVKLPFDVIPN